VSSWHWPVGSRQRGLWSLRENIAPSHLGRGESTDQEYRNFRAGLKPRPSSPGEKSRLRLRHRRRRVPLCGGTGRRSGSVGGGGSRGSATDRVAAGLSSGSGINVRRQRVRAEAELHQRFRLRKACHREAVITLVAPHRLARLLVPMTIRLCFEIPCLGQSLLDLLNTFRPRAQPSPPAPRRGARSPRRNVPLGGTMGGAVLAGRGWGLGGAVL
jgi:hypothetical protein